MGGGGKSETVRNSKKEASNKHRGNRGGGSLDGSLGRKGLIRERGSFPKSASSVQTRPRNSGVASETGWNPTATPENGELDNTWGSKMGTPTSEKPE